MVDSKDCRLDLSRREKYNEVTETENQENECVLCKNGEQCDSEDK